MLDRTVLGQVERRPGRVPGSSCVRLERPMSSSGLLADDDESLRKTCWLVTFSSRPQHKGVSMFGHGDIVVILNV